jgi:hypothetical protein
MSSIKTCKAVEDIVCENCINNLKQGLVSNLLTVMSSFLGKEEEKQQADVESVPPWLTKEECLNVMGTLKSATLGCDGLDFNKLHNFRIPIGSIFVTDKTAEFTIKADRGNDK